MLTISPQYLINILER